MPWTESPGFHVGTVTVVTTQDGGHSLEYFADRIVDKLIFLADETPEPLRAQVMAYREKMRDVVLYGLRRAIESHDAYRKDR